MGPDDIAISTIPSIEVLGRIVTPDHGVFSVCG